jgi:hypothetical protein
MVAFSKNPDGPRCLDLCRARFAEMLPQIRQEASAALRDVPPDRRAALVEEVIQRAFSTLLKLAERGRMQIAYAKPLTMVAVKQLRGRPTNVRSG